MEVLTEQILELLGISRNYRSAPVGPSSVTAAQHRAATRKI